MTHLLSHDLLVGLQIRYLHNDTSGCELTEPLLGGNDWAHPGARPAISLRVERTILLRLVPLESARSFRDSAIVGRLHGQPLG